MRRRSKQVARFRARGAACLLAALVALGGCASMAGRDPVEVNVARITPLPSTAFEHRLSVDLRLRNPKNRDFQIEGLRFVLEVNGQRLASGVTSEAVTLPRLGEVVVPVTTTTTLLDLVNQILAFGQQPQPRFEYMVRGKLFLKGLWGSVSFEHHGSDRDLLARVARPAPTSSSKQAR